VNEHAFSATERQAVYRVIAERRDMRRFVPNAVVPEEVLARLLHAAHSAPSVGLMRGDEFLSLKVEGILECAELLVVALCDGRQTHVFGRRTLPQVDLASASCAIQNRWLAARAEGLGMGWVSIFDPVRLGALLAMPEGAEPVAVLCLGPVPDFPHRPQLEIDEWTLGRPLSEFVSENGWAPHTSPIGLSS
jgi:5,6-dimethylbenzimidazole synthase